jgi:hypothetical protein
MHADRQASMARLISMELQFFSVKNAKNEAVVHLIQFLMSAVF